MPTSGKRKRKIKFLTLYNSFTDKEKSEFFRFIRSGLHGSKRDYNKILTLLNTGKDGIAEIASTENSRTRWNRLSELNILAEKFLIYKSIDSDNFYKNFLLIKEYDKRSFEDLANAKAKSLLSDYTRGFYHHNVSPVQYLNEVYLRQVNPVLRSEKFSKKLAEADSLRWAIFYIELFEHLLQQLDFKQSRILRKGILSDEFVSGIDFTKIFSVLSRNVRPSNKIFLILKFLNMLYLSYKNINDKNYYLKAKKIFFKDLKPLPIESRAKYYLYIQNFNIYRVNILFQGAEEELFFILNEKLKEGITDDLENNEISSNHFRNYILIGLKLRKLRWVNNFINKYSSYVPADTRDDYVLLGKALVAFNKNDFLLCMELLTKIDHTKDAYFFVDVTVHKLKVLFELKKFVECHDELKKIDQYLRKERIVNEFLIIYASEFCKAFTLLLKVNQKPTKNNLSDLQFILSKKNLLSQNWLGQKAEGIIPGM